MKIFDDILATLDFNWLAKDIRVGPFQTAVLTRHCGFASTPHNGKVHCHRVAVADAGQLLTKDSRTLAEIATSGS